MSQRYAAATYVGRMCPGACAQDTFLMQCYNRWEDKKEDKALKDISNTQNVGLGEGGSIDIYWLLAIQQVFSQLGGNGSAGMEPAIQQLLLAT